MTPKLRAAHRATLQRLRAQVLRSGPARIEPNRRDPTTSGVTDEDEQALSEMMQVLASQRNRGQSDLLARIDRALLKLETTPEDYGLCEDCEEEIAPRRLALMPHAALCPECQAKREPKHPATRRRLTDYDQGS
jgi:DnaK suppressor protein